MKSVICIAVLLSSASAAQADVRNDYELTVSVVKTALAGWQLYNKEQVAGQFQDGYYTDPNPQTKGKDFWSNGRYATLDREGTGHFETVFAVRGKELVYVGSLGAQGSFVDTAKEYRQFQGTPVAAFVKTLDKR